MTARTPVSIEKQMEHLLRQALRLADESTLARLGDLLTYLSEGADLRDYAVDVPDGLEHKAVFKRMLMSRQLLDQEPLGHA
jgi:hypothetical protein